MIENGRRMFTEYNSIPICALRTKIQGIAVMYMKFNVTFHAIKSKMRDTINFELDPYSAFRKASEDATVPDQPMWGLLVWQVVGIFMLGFVFVCAVSCYCCERYSVRIPKIQKKLITPKDGQEEALVALTQTETLGDWRISAASETNC
ncbi:PREDICTED: uncharacterized protein LOC107352014 isoform X1 [Acropora digitifera]|uniref:uncharacterized protein LOC107352014 isoform X1 n=1 Tax=Acropora digitifera TaxID=70779 RepID=UPI00077A4532|nr:PREDICTED: uncharacterized protein LOC107352014 isoform X1 [Acropora digitifera]